MHRVLRGDVSPVDHDDIEVTATMKVRRRTIHEKLAPLIAELYDPQKATPGEEQERVSR